MFVFFLFLLLFVWEYVMRMHWNLQTGNVGKPLCVHQMYRLEQNVCESLNESVSYLFMDELRKKCLCTYVYISAMQFSWRCKYFNILLSQCIQINVYFILLFHMCLLQDASKEIVICTWPWCISGRQLVMIELSITMPFHASWPDVN